MIKKLMILMAVILTGCQEASQPSRRNDQSLRSVGPYVNVHDTSIGGHEYLVTSRGGIIHAEHCTNHLKISDLNLGPHIYTK